MRHFAQGAARNEYGMETTNEQMRVQARNAEKWLFEKSVSRRQIHDEIDRLLAGLAGDQRVLISAGVNPVASRRVAGGAKWQRFYLAPLQASPLVELVNDGKALGHEAKLPLANESADVVVLLDVLQHIEADAAWVEECHRVLKPTGRLLIEVPSVKRWSLLVGLRTLFGLSRHNQGRARKGYTEPMLFDLIKDGFDAEEMFTFSRFFVGAAETNADLLAALMGVDRDLGSQNVNQEIRALDHLRKVYTWLYPFALLGAGLDKLIGFTRGYRLIGRFRRRPWKPRRSPTLRDGRSIAEATINTRIGTAAPF